MGLTGVGVVLFVAQATQATVAGTVRDEPTGRPIAGAVVALTGLDRVTSADAQGRYRLAGVPPGPHHLAVRFIGYEPRTLHAFVPSAGSLEVDVALRPHPIPLSAIEVTRRRPIAVPGVEPRDSASFPERRISMAAVRDHPLLAEPDAFQALAGGEVVLRPESPGGVHLRGGAADHVAYLLDGIPVFNPYHVGGVFSAWNPDALDELSVSSAMPSPALPDALSGAVAGITRRPGTSLRGQGALSTTHARFTFDGPLGGAGFLVSLRSGFPGLFAPRDEASYLRGEMGDRLAKLEIPILGGRARLLGYDSESELSAAAIASFEGRPESPSPRNLFEWTSRSLGAEWTRSLGRVMVRVLGWSAAGEAAASWTEGSAPLALSAERHDQGGLAAVERRAARSSAVLGVRVVHEGTRYRIAPSASGLPTWQARSGTATGTAFAQYRRSLGPRLDGGLGASVGIGGGGPRLGPRVQLRWRPTGRLALSGSYARQHQFAQSLRNAESLVGMVFPVDLYLGVGAPGVPVARSDQAVLAADYRPVAGLRVGIQGYARRMTIPRHESRRARRGPGSWAPGPVEASRGRSDVAGFCRSGVCRPGVAGAWLGQDRHIVGLGRGPAAGPTGSPGGE